MYSNRQPRDLPSLKLAFSLSVIFAFFVIHLHTVDTHNTNTSPHQIVYYNYLNTLIEKINSSLNIIVYLYLTIPLYIFSLLLVYLSLKLQYGQVIGLYILKFVSVYISI